MSNQTASPRFAGPLNLIGPAIERDGRVLEFNNAPKPNEAQWIAAAKEANEAISASELEFFSELRYRSKT